MGAFKQFGRAAKVNWKTTALGVAMILGAVSTFLVATLDGDPNTHPDILLVWEKVQLALELISATLAAGGVAAVFARDGNKSSRQSIID